MVEFRLIRCSNLSSIGDFSRLWSVESFTNESPWCVESLALIRYKFGLNFPSNNRRILTGRELLKVEQTWQNSDFSMLKSAPPTWFSLPFSRANLLPSGSRNKCWRSYGLFKHLTVWNFAHIEEKLVGKLCSFRIYLTQFYSLFYRRKSWLFSKSIG